MNYFGPTDTQMELSDTLLEPVDTSLYDFAREVVYLLGQILLPLSFRMESNKKMICFLIIDIPSTYNVILGPPVLNTFQVVVFTYHMKMKFSARKGVGEVTGKQHTTRKCYVESVKKGNKNDVEINPPQRNKKLMQYDEQGNELFA
ncbi:UNVERIFIED_CONTAM: hypothetical protein Slati_1766000 [Sesamum latifolium]|uniref:Uncharacterized protein n=1 Tax=Sesamum latifolium TaxID=2727402 RepID=A0AAW2X2V5_9LAMI